MKYNIIETTLLSEDEYYRYRDTIPCIGKPWWLRSPGYDSDYAADVDSNGAVYADGYYVFNTTFGVRPAFRIGLSYPEIFCAGDQVFVNGLKCTVLDVRQKQNEIYVLSDTIVECRRFDKESNDWEKSELKAYLNQKFIEQKKIVDVYEYKLALIDEFGKQLSENAQAKASVEDFIAILEDSVEALKSKLYCDLEQTEQEEETEL